jgi:DNA adenine methylase
VELNRLDHARTDEAVTASAPATNRRLMVSPLRYPGGKGALYSRLRQVIRSNGLAGCTYVEPFAGGAGAGLGLLVTGQVSKVVINDLDPAVYAFWASLVADPEKMIARIKKVPLTVKEWRRQKEIHASDDADLDRLGFATFYLNRTNRSGVLNGGPIGGLDQTGNYLIDARFNRQNLAERIRTLGLFRNNIVVTRTDGRAVVRKYAAKADTFVYADPPYFEKAGSLYMNYFQADDHAALARDLNAKSDGHWLLTYDAVPQVDELYAARRIRSFGLSYSAHRVTKATEVAVLSDSLIDIGEGWPLA